MSWDALVSRLIEHVEGLWPCMAPRQVAERVCDLVGRELGRELTGGERQDIGEACGLLWR